MLVDSLEQILIELSNAFGPSGFEREVQAVFQNAVAEYTDISYDNLGSIIARRRGSKIGPKVLLAAHLDEVGLMVRGVLPGGCLKAVPLGGWWSPALVAQAVLIRSRYGDHRGVIGAKPPHYMKEDDPKRQLSLSELYIDVGAKSRREVADLGIAPGDPITPDVKVQTLSPHKTLLGKAFDDRAGCAALIQVLRELVAAPPNQVIGAGTVQEEVGMRGARALAAQLQPDLCLVLEGAPADDFPDAGPIAQGKMGGGPQLRYYDPSMLANRHLFDLTVQEAQKLQIPYQVAVREGGGTDGGAIQVQASGGVPTLVIGVPVRYAHSHHGIIQLDDVEASVALVKALLYRLDDATVLRIKRQPWGI
jgi:putative aminopeptidase FrvX